jgi:cytoskeletal protein CcmA (bactofilin family)
MLVTLSTALVSHAAPTPKAETTDSGNVYISGAQVAVTVPVHGDLFAAGGRVSVEREVDADAAVAGGSVDVRGRVGQDLRVAGGSAMIDGDVGGELMAVGGTVRVADSSSVTGSAWLAGSDVALSGKIGRGVKIIGNKIAVSGEIDGDTRLYGQDIKLLPGARINGNLSYASPNPLSQDAAAQVSGTVTREGTPERWNNVNEGGRVSIWFHPVFVLSMIATGMLLCLLVPDAVRGVQHTVGRYPVRCLLTGLALLFAVPPAVIFLMITLIGIPLGLILLALYPVMLLFGYLGAAFFIAARAADAMRQPQPLRLGRQALFLTLALVILNLLVLIPFLGGFLMFVLLLAGIGGWAVWIYMQYRARHARSTTGEEKLLTD